MAPILSFVFFYLTKYFWFWTHGPVVKQTVWLGNLIIKDAPFGWELNTFVPKFHNLRELFAIDISGYSFTVVGYADIGFTTMCTGVQAIAIFAGLILMIPHSKNDKVNKTIWWRKLLSLIVSSLIFYIVNIARMILQIGLYYNGWNWDDIHVSISAASSFIAALIIILMHRWIPEFIISIIWTLGELKQFFINLKIRKTPVKI